VRVRSALRRGVEMFGMMIGIIFIVLGILGLLHQRFFTSGGWWNWNQFWHHEPLIAASIAFGAGWIMGGFL
tara:strand:- start:456 stop:668 length:213 start_codon:yes stop_codon:yes gene_type:complete